MNRNTLYFIVVGILAWVYGYISGFTMAHVYFIVLGLVALCSIIGATMAFHRNKDSNFGMALCWIGYTGGVIFLVKGVGWLNASFTTIWVQFPSALVLSVLATLAVKKSDLAASILDDNLSFHVLLVLSVFLMVHGAWAAVIAAAIVSALLGGRNGARPKVPATSPRRFGLPF